jgi:Na+/proline symporter
VGQLGIGLGYPGMPHVIIRYITVRNDKEAVKASRITILWSVVVLFGMVTLGIAGRVIFPEMADAEKVLPAFAREFLHPVFWTRALIGIMTVIAMILALDKDRVIYSFVLYAWGALGAAFTPIIILSLYWKRFNKWGALASLIAGPLVNIIWANIDTLQSALYELVPAAIASFLAAIVVSLMTSGDQNNNS